MHTERGRRQLRNKTIGDAAIIPAILRQASRRLLQPGDSNIVMSSDTGTNRWFAQRYNVNNAWIFNGNNGNLNNNNVNNTNRARALAKLS